MLSPLSSFFVKRFGARVTIPFGAAICAIGFLGSAFATNIYLVCLTYGFVVAWGSCLIYISGYMTVNLYFDKRRSLATAMVSAGPWAGFVLISPISQSLIEHLGWRQAMLVLGGINLIACFLGCGITRRMDNRRVSPGRPAPKSPKRVKTVLSNVFSSLKASAFKDPLLALVFTLTFFISLAYEMPVVHLVSL